MRRMSVQDKKLDDDEKMQRNNENRRHPLSYIFAFFFPFSFLPCWQSCFKQKCAIGMEPRRKSAKAQKRSSFTNKRILPNCTQFCNLSEIHLQKRRAVGLSAGEQLHPATARRTVAYSNLGRSATSRQTSMRLLGIGSKAECGSTSTTFIISVNDTERR